MVDTQLSSLDARTTNIVTFISLLLIYDAQLHFARKIIDTSRAKPQITLLESLPYHKPTQHQILNPPLLPLIRDKNTIKFLMYLCYHLLG